MSFFKDLWRLLKETDNDWMSVIANLQKSRKSQYQLDRILGWEGTNTVKSVIFYVTVNQSIFLL